MPLKPNFKTYSKAVVIKIFILMAQELIGYRSIRLKLESRNELIHIRFIDFSNRSLNNLIRKDYPCQQTMLRKQNIYIQKNELQPYLMHLFKLIHHILYGVKLWREREKVYVCVRVCVCTCVCECAHLL